jgi:hypothetical protein
MDTCAHYCMLRRSTYGSLVKADDPTLATLASLLGIFTPLIGYLQLLTYSEFHSRNKKLTSRSAHMYIPFRL